MSLLYHPLLAQTHLQTEQQARKEANFNVIFANCAFRPLLSNAPVTARSIRCLIPQGMPCISADHPWKYWQCRGDKCTRDYTDQSWGTLRCAGIHPEAGEMWHPCDTRALLFLNGSPVLGRLAPQPAVAAAGRSAPVSYPHRV